ncbi:integrase core domain-containing protein [Halomonas sp. hl-4]|uniref:integrase core domain-containing protein n=1 Tax=Halomonas sp. hl-4 TaxID=1761789 RepID=UPI000BB71BBE
MKRYFRSLKEECLWLHRFDSVGLAREVIRSLSRYYNEARQHQLLDYVALA